MSYHIALIYAHVCHCKRNVFLILDKQFGVKNEHESYLLLLLWKNEKIFFLMKVNCQIKCSLDRYVSFFLVMNIFNLKEKEKIQLHANIHDIILFFFLF